MFTVNARNLIAKVKKVGEYTKGYMTGLQAGKAALMQKIGVEVSALAGDYIDTMAAGNPSQLHHMYEWGSVGGARLFDISFTATTSTVTFMADYKQSSSVAPTATVPFYNKAEVMESGQSVTITPVAGGVLRFFGDDGVVYTPNPVTVNNPGGPNVAGGFQKALDSFFSSYIESLILGGLLQRIAALETFDIGGGGYGAGYTAGYRQVSRVSIGGVSL